MTESQERDRLYSQLVKLGDMMGDGLHYEVGGKWIEREYRNICVQLGLVTKKPKANNSKKINEFMDKRISETSCDKCGSILKQSRSGSLVAKCIECGQSYRLGKRAV